MEKRIKLFDLVQIDNGGPMNPGEEGRIQLFLDFADFAADERLPAAVMDFQIIPGCLNPGNFRSLQKTDFAGTLDGETVDKGGRGYWVCVDSLFEVFLPALDFLQKGEKGLIARGLGRGVRICLACSMAS